MITQINYTKMVASGNDFIVVDQRRCTFIHRLSPFAVQICDRKYGVGADGLLILEKSRKADLKMRIFNPDGSEPQMCGNGVRCVAFYIVHHRQTSVPSRQQRPIRIETKAGVIQAKVNRAEVNPVRKKSPKGKGLSNGVKIKMTEPRDIKLALSIKIAKRKIKVNFINTGVVHTVIFVEGLDKINVVDIGRQVRFYKRFLPEGTNVDFVQIIDDNNIKLRTYERGVEDETLACGTGTVAAALITNHQSPITNHQKINVHTKSGEVLRVEFDRINGRFKDIWLEGKAKIVYSGVYYV